MSEKKLVGVEFSSEAGVDLQWKEGKLRMVMSYDGKGVDAGVYCDLEPDYFLEKLKAAIPGDVDDKVIDMLRLAMKAV
jgi:hypothetical protein